MLQYWLFVMLMVCCSQKAEGFNLRSLKIRHGISQGSVLGPLLFTICICSVNGPVAHFSKLYADDTVTYCSAPSQYQVFCLLQDTFNIVEDTFQTLKLVWHLAKKQKQNRFTNSKTESLNLILVTTIDCI